MAKKAANGAGHVRLRPDGRWEGQYLKPIDPATGKRKPGSVYAKTKEECAKKLRKICAEIDNGLYKSPSKLTVGQWARIWLDEYNGHLAPGTKEKYEGYANNYIIPRLGKLKLSALTKPIMQKFINSIEKTPLDPEKGISAKTVKNVHGAVSKMLKQAVEVDYLPANPATGCKLPRVEAEEARAFNLTEAAAFMQQIRGEVFENAYLVTMYTGMREGEVLGLQWDCVDFDEGVLHIKRQLQIVNHEYTITTPKRNKPRKVYASQFVMEILKQQQWLQAQWKRRAGAAWLDAGYVFTNELGEHIKRQTIYKHFKNAAEAIGCGEMTFHGLRHTYVSVAIKSGADFKNIQASSGHSKASFMLDRYGHAMADAQKDNAAKMDAMISEIQAKQTGQK